MVKLVLLSLFLTSCLQVDNSHSGDKAQNSAIEELDDILNKDPSQRTVSENAFVVLRQRCTNCHYHNTWELTDSYWLEDNNYSTYIEYNNNDPDGSYLIDRLRVWGKGLGPQNMPDNGYVLSEDEYNYLKNWVIHIHQQKI